MIEIIGEFDIFFGDDLRHRNGGFGHLGIFQELNIRRQAGQRERADPFVVGISRRKVFLPSDQLLRLSVQVLIGNRPALGGE
jgi:hypothetical protein